MMKKELAHIALTIFGIFTLAVHGNAQELTEEFLAELKVLPLRSALARGIQKNLELQIQELNIPISRQEVTATEAEFDPAVDASFFSLEQKSPTGSSFSTEETFNLSRETGGDIGIRKKFTFGLQSRLSFEVSRSMNNSATDALRPQYHNFLILNLTQPLLRDFGTKVNTANLRISKNQVNQTVYNYMERAQRIASEIELAYYELAEALEVLRYRIESRELARELLRGNREKFERGLVPITEVQQAETAVAARDEQVVFARQQVEMVSNRLKDFLEIRPGDPLYGELFATEKIPGVDQSFPDLEKALAVALEKRPDLERQRIDIANRDIRLEFCRNQRLPRIDLEATLGVNGLSGGDRLITFGGTTASSPLVGDYLDSLSRMAEHDGYEWFVGLRFSYPLGNRAAKARFRRADWEKRQAIYRLKRLEGKVETEVKNALVAVVRSAERVRVAERFERLAEKTLEQEMERLKEGLSDTFHILDLQDDLIEACIRKTTALVDFHQGLASLYRAMGTNLERFRIIAEINMKEITHAE
jgi:outer membrane protein TolC